MDRDEHDGGFGRRAFLGRAMAVGGAAAALGTVHAAAAAGSAPAVPGPKVVVTTLTGQAIQQAINALPPSGGTVQLVDGTYAINASLVLHANSALVGASRTGTILRLSAGVNKNVVVNNDVTNGDTNVVIRSLTIDGNRTQQTAGPANGVELHRCTNCTIDDVEIHHCVTTGLVTSGDGQITRVGRLSSMYVHDNGQHGLSCYWAMREISYIGIIADHNGDTGMWIGHSEAAVTGVQCNRNGVDGFRTDSIFACRIEGVTANLNGRYGIHLLALIDSVGASWTAQNNGQSASASDIFFDDGAISYGPSDHTLISGVMCGPAHVSTWGAPYPTGRATETYGMSFAPGVKGNIAVIGVYCSNGKLGRYLLPPVDPSSKLLIVEHEFANADFRIVRGNLEVPAGNFSQGGGNVGFFGTAPVAKPTVTGAKGSSTALASLLTALAQLGLITNSTT
jgi:hypothetical protein